MTAAAAPAATPAHRSTAHASPRAIAVIEDFLERAGWSAGQVFFSTLLAGGVGISVATLPWRYAVTLAASAAVASAVLTGVQYLTRTTKLPYLADLAVRLVKTFLASLAASFTAAHPFDLVTFHWTPALNLAVVAVITCLGKGVLARGIDGSGGTASPTPSTLATPTYTAAVAA